jgi:S1-C subfamily serine protease
MRRLIPLAAVSAMGMMALGTTGQENSNQDEKPKVMVAYLGVTTRAPTDEEVEKCGLSFRVRAQGQVVTSVDEGGPAREAGIVEGDAVVAFDKNDIYSQDDIADYLRVSRPGSEVSIKLRSPENGEVETVTLTLGEQELSAEEAKKGLRWQFASLGQLPGALEIARSERKTILVGLSGAET